MSHTYLQEAGHLRGTSTNLLLFKAEALGFSGDPPGQASAHGSLWGQDCLIFVNSFTGSQPVPCVYMSSVAALCYSEEFATETTGPTNPKMFTTGPCTEEGPTRVQDNTHRDDERLLFVSSPLLGLPRGKEG